VIKLRLILSLLLSLAASPALADPTTDLGIHLMLDETSGTTAQDSTANNRDGTLSGATFVADGWRNFCLDVQDANDSMTVGTTDLTPGGVGSGSLWLKWNGTSSATQVIATKQDTFATGDLQFQWYYIPGTSIIGFNVPGPGTSAIFSNSDGDVTPAIGRWEHYAYAMSGGNVTLWKNGNLIATRAFTPGSDTAAIIRVGSNAATSAFNFEGQIDDVRFYPGRALDTAGVAEIMVAGSITVQSPMWRQVVARDENTTLGDIPISGHYEGSPTAIEARFDGGAWSTIDASPAGGEFSGTLQDQPTGDGNLDVRFTNDTAQTFTQPLVGVGRVYVIGGQSNAAGEFDNDQPYTGAAQASMVTETIDAWQPLADPTNSDIVSGSVWPRVATHLSDDEPDCPLGFIFAADGGTGLVSNGVNDYSWAWDEQLSGTSYLDMLERVTVSGAQTFTGMAWHQGEAEIYESELPARYRARTLKLIENVNADFLDGAPVYVGQIGQVTAPVLANAHGIRNQQVKVWDHPDAEPGPALYSSDLSGGDSLHGKTDATAIEWAAWWHACLTERGPPVIRSLTSTTGSPTLVATYDDDLDAGSLSTAPFVITGSLGGARTISAATASGDEVTFTLTTNAQADEVFTLDFAKNNTGQGVTIPTSTATGLPAAAQTFVQPGGLKAVLQ
jgi:hypothetical protein